MEMPVHPDEGFLHQVLRPLAVVNHAVNEVHQPPPVAPDQGREGVRFTGQMCLDQFRRAVLSLRCPARRFHGLPRHPGHAFPPSSRANQPSMRMDKIPCFMMFVQCYLNKHWTNMMADRVFPS